MSQTALTASQLEWCHRNGFAVLSNVSNRGLEFRRAAENTGTAHHIFYHRATNSWVVQLVGAKSASRATYAQTLGGAFRAYFRITYQAAH